jgi:hypothetical protein
MSSFIWGAVALGVIFIIWFVAGLAGKSARLRQREQELEEWEGVLDVKRETKRELSDPDELKRMHDKYNPPE